MYGYAHDMTMRLAGGRAMATSLITCVTVLNIQQRDCSPQAVLLFLCLIDRHIFSWELFLMRSYLANRDLTDGDRLLGQAGLGEGEPVTERHHDFLYPSLVTVFDTSKKTAEASVVNWLLLCLFFFSRLSNPMQRMSSCMVTTLVRI